MAEQFQVTEYLFDSDHEVITLLNKVFDPWIAGKSYFDWKYKRPESVVHDFPNAWVIKHQGKIVAFNGYALRRLKSGQKSLVCAQSFDTATDPEYRGQGLFGILQKGVYEHMRKNGIAWVYGWTSEIGYKVFTKKCGWSVWSQQTNLMKVLNPKSYTSTVFQNPVLQGGAQGLLALHGRFRKPVHDQQTSIHHSQTFPDDINELCKQAIDSFDFIAERDQKYLNWRVSNPKQECSMIMAKKGGRYSGYLAYSTTQDALHIEDCLVIEPAALTSLLAEVEQIGQEANKTVIRFRVNEHHPLVPVFKKAGYFWSKTHFPMLGLQLRDEPRLNSNTSNKHWTAFDRNE